ncbi:autophagy-related protein 22-like protein [Endogone sp. FLAS-F59071]|nr:autophagy-related protein 22-like protein [Endogone sp. FLAS-F59071]|eukprot:RUS16065.1 autophagy-related protein 22-like protein [Endogone sp. FLAS-F59071]
MEFSVINKIVFLFDLKKKRPFFEEKIPLPSTPTNGPETVMDHFGPSETAVTKGELWGSEGFAGAAMNVFIPLIILTMATSVSVSAFDHTQPCDHGDPNNVCQVQFGALWVSPASFALYTSAVGVGIQAVIFVWLGALADHSKHGKRFLLLFTFLGSAISMLWVFINNPSYYWAAAILSVFGSICYGASQVFHVAYLPRLTRNHPDVCDATPQYYQIAWTDTVSALSANAKGMQHVGGLINMVLSIGILLVWGSTTYSMQIAATLGAAWWFLLTFVTVFKLKSRGGPPLPAGESFMVYSWKKVYKTTRSIRQLSQTYKFLLAWFLLSDGFNTIQTVAILFSQSALHAGNTQLVIAATISPLASLLGIYFFLWVQHLTGARPKTMMLWLACLGALCPAYVLLGQLNTVPFGLKSVTELYIVAGYFGFLVSGISSYCRSMFAQMVPKGHENEFFAFFQITAAGSSWLGPMITGIISDVTGTLFLLHPRRYRRRHLPDGDGGYGAWPTRELLVLAE